MTLKLIHAEPPKGKFIAIYNDGSGANLFLIDDQGKLYSHEYYECSPDELDNYLHWIPLPDDYKFWGDLL